MTNTRTPISERVDFSTDDGYRDCILDYRRHLRARGLADGTVRARLHAIDVLHAVHPDLLRVTVHDLEAFLSNRRRYAPETRKNWRVGFRVFYRWALERELVDNDPAAELRPVRIPRKAARIADDGGLVTALRTASLPEKAMVLLGRDACLRLSEIARLHTSDREGATLYIVGKGEVGRNVPIGGDLELMLDQLQVIQGPGYFFPGRFGSHIHPQSLNKIITRVAGTNPHSLRHAGATAAYRGSQDVRAVQELLGHQSLATTQRYVHVGFDQIRNAAQSGALGLNHGALSVLDRVAFDSNAAPASRAEVPSE